MSGVPRPTPGGRIARTTIARIPREQALPKAAPPLLRSIHWTPDGHADPGMREHAIFITQGALREVSRHVWSRPDRDLLGFLLGERRESPETGAKYVLVTATTRASYDVPEEGDSVINEEAWHASHLEARRRKTQVVGWYRSASYVADGPDLRDLQSHLAHFPEPWQLGLVLAPRTDRPAGGVFRAGDQASAEEFLPFHEVVDDNALLPDGQKRTVIPWTNYAPDVPPARASQVAVARPKLGAGTIPIIRPQPRAEDQARGLLTRRRKQHRYLMSRRRQRERRKRMLLATGTLLTLGALAAAALSAIR